MFIDPPLSHTGLHECEAREKGLNIRVNKIAVSSIPRAGALGETEGMLKAVIDMQTDEIINLVAMAKKAGIKGDFLRDFIFTHPSMSETFNDLLK